MSLIYITRGIIGFTVLHGILLFVVLAAKQRSKPAQNTLKFIVLALNLYLGEFFLAISGVLGSVPHLIFVSHPVLYCIGPLFFIFAQKATRSFQTKTYYWFLIPLLVTIAFLPFYFSSASYKLSVQCRSVALANTFPWVDFFVSNMAIFYLYTAVFLGMAIRLILAKSDPPQLARPLVRFFKGVRWLLLLIAFVSVFGQGMRYIWMGYVLLLLPLVFALSLHLLGYWVILNPNINQAFVTPLKQTYKKSPLPKAYKDKYVARLQCFLEEEKPYLHPDFSPEVLASKLGVSRHYISQILSQELKLSFTELTHQLRIAEACKLLQAEAKPVVQTVALEVGYNNKMSFYRAFKKITHQTPSEYLQSLKKSNNPTQ